MVQEYSTDYSNMVLRIDHCTSGSTFRLSSAPKSGSLHRTDCSSIPGSFSILFRRLSQNDDVYVYFRQIWRLLTAVLFFPLGFNYLINLYFIYQYSSRLETSTRKRRLLLIVIVIIFI